MLLKEYKRLKSLGPLLATRKRVVTALRVGGMNQQLYSPDVGKVKMVRHKIKGKIHFTVI
jgi:hypothetical protein